MPPGAHRELRTPTSLTQDRVPGKGGILRNQSPHSAALPSSTRSSQTIRVCSAGLVPKLKGEGPCSSFSLLLSCLPLTEIINKHWLNECPLGILPGKGPSNFTFYKSVQRQWHYSTEHSNSRSLPHQENESRSIWFSLLIKSFSLEPSLETHTQKVETVSFTDWKTSLWRSVINLAKA